MTPAKLKRKTKNHLLSMAKALYTLTHEQFTDEHGLSPAVLDHYHDFAMRCYSEGYTHGQVSGREAEESKS